MKFQTKVDNFRISGYRRKFTEFVRILFPWTLLLALLVALYATIQNESRTDSLQVREELNIGLGGRAVIQELDSVLSDLLAVSRNSWLSVSGGINGIDDHFVHTLKVFSEEKGLYDQIRVIDMNGDEIMRIDHRQGEAHVRPASELQNKADRYYFKESVTLERGEVFISPLDLNMEHGEIERPLKPMIRFVTPVFDNLGGKRGVLVLNYYATRLIERFRSAVANIADHAMIVTNEGYWIAHPDPDREWGFMLNRDERYMNDHGMDVWKRIASSETGQFYSGDGLHTYSTVWPLKTVGHGVESGGESSHIRRQNYVDGYYWKMISHVPQAALDDHRYEILGQIFIVAVPLYLLLIGICWILASQKVEQKRIQTDLRLAASVFEQVTEGVLITDDKNIIRSVNPAFTRITGYTQDEVVGCKPSILSSGKQGKTFYQEMWVQLARHGCWEGEIWNKKKSGEVYPERLSIVAINKERSSGVAAYAALFQDITEEKVLQNRLIKHAHFDNLTGLANRLLFMDRLDQAVTESSRRGDTFALMFIDLDRFKVINDTIGHDAGDEVLRQVSLRISQVVRQSDTVARLGGDEFTVILKNLVNNGDAAIVGEKIIEVVAKPVNIDGQDVFIGSSIGITVFPDDGTDVETLLRNADLAMYQSKQSGRSQYHFFSNKLNSFTRQKLEIEQELRKAIENRDLSLHYQPIIDPRHQSISSAEALLRWNHAEKGMISPDIFIPVAEETGLIEQIGEWVMYEAVRQAKEWTDLGLPKFSTSVNLSSRQLRLGFNRAFVEKVLDEHGLATEHIMFEITETAMMEDSDASLKWLDSLRELGIKISIDDFGTGYSSLGYLKRFPVDVVKIDRSFIKNITTDRDDQSLTRAIIAMADSLGLAVVAEGVENATQLDLLTDMAEFGIKIQGFHYSKPLPADEFVQFVRSFQAE